MACKCVGVGGENDSMVELEGVGGGSGSERGASGHGSALLAKPRMHMGEGHIPELHVCISPDAQLVALRVNRDKQVTLVGDPDNDVASQEQGFQSVIGTVVLVMDQGERHGLESTDDIRTGHALCTMKGRENVCLMLFCPNAGGHVVWTPKHGIDAESMGVSCAMRVFGKEKVFGNNWECSSSRESREGKLGTGVNLHQTRGSYGCGQITEANLTWAVAAGAAGAEMVARTVSETEAAEMVGAMDKAKMTAGRQRWKGKGSGKACVKTEGTKVTAVVMMGNTKAMVMAGRTGTSEATMGKGEAYGSDGR
ncbi:hypothetical protein F5148DRAFT_1319598 [Russula earlei]|uniref:Uncharacterized protein n=1 Tax=Russula earlei TaxID=71964 RepID=A0ACC0UIR3_9AGAM|nr:hypothetical protein F5148DRAFT_1319598 [Russula earlei]